MTTSLDDYLDRLDLELRLLGVSPERARAAADEVRAHVADTGEAAVDSFGSPTAYARTYAEATSPTAEPLFARRGWTLRFWMFVQGVALVPIAMAGSELARMGGVVITVQFLAYYAVVAVVGALVTEWLARPMVARQSATSPRSTLLEAPRMLVLGGIGALIVADLVTGNGPAGLVVSWQGMGDYAFSVSPAILPLVGIALVAASIWLDIRAGRARR